MAASREGGCAAVALDEHRVLVAGDNSHEDHEDEWRPGDDDFEDDDAGSKDVLVSEVLDVRTMAFALGPSMSSVRNECAAVRVDAQHVLFIGGQDASGTALATTELLDVATMEFAPGPTMPAGRSGCAAIRLDVAGGRPRILVIGGDNGGRCLSTTLVLAA
jgi:hypothetical protein